MSLYASCPCGIPEGLDQIHLRTDCPHYGAAPISPGRMIVGEMNAFAREERYIVIKRSHHSAEQLDQLGDAMFLSGIGQVRAVVVEADWPEYEPVWQMIEARVTGKPRPADSDVIGKLVEAARHLCFNFLLDERDNERFCVGAEHHKAIVELFEALEEGDTAREALALSQTGKSVQ